MPKPKLSDDQISDILVMYRTGAPICDIAEKYHVSIPAICYRLERSGERMRSETRKKFKPVRSTLPEIMSLAANIEMPTTRRLLIDPSTRA